MDCNYNDDKLTTLKLYDENNNLEVDLTFNKPLELEDLQYILNRHNPMN